jgi:hypothetical protein
MKVRNPLSPYFIRIVEVKWPPTDPAGTKRLRMGQQLMWGEPPPPVRRAQLGPASATTLAGVPHFSRVLCARSGDFNPHSKPFQTSLQLIRSRTCLKYMFRRPHPRPKVLLSSLPKPDTLTSGPVYV